jgi:hypothetical protein
MKMRTEMRKEITQECTITISRDEFMVWLREYSSIGKEIPDDVTVEIDASGCHCDEAPVLDEEHDLIIRWKTHKVENSET